MGLEDRDYLREEARRYGGMGGGFYAAEAGRNGPWRMVTILVMICSALYLLDAFTPPIRPVDESGNQGPVVSNFLFDWMALKSNDVFSTEVLRAPWNLYQLVSYGFAHASMSTPRSVFHILFNMLVLWMLGRMVEDRMGRHEFLCFYLLAIIFSALFWGIFHIRDPAVVIGASGAVTGVVILFAFYFPNQQVFLFGIVPIPGWLVGVLIVGQDFLLALTGGTDRVAYEAHLGGAAFAAIYFYSRIRFDAWVPTKFLARLIRKTPSLRVHDPDADDRVDRRLESEEKQADEILVKLHQQGESSLSRRERKILERYSKRIREKKQE